MKFDFLHIRVPAETKKKLKEAAKLASQEQGRVVTMSAFVTEAALKECQRIFRRFRVDPADLPVEDHPE